MKPFVWLDRLVKLEYGCLMFSRKGKHDDFDFFPEKPSDDMAVALGVDGTISGARPRWDGALLIEQTFGGDCVLSGDQWSKCVLSGPLPPGSVDEPVSVEVPK